MQSENKYICLMQNETTCNEAEIKKKENNPKTGWTNKKSCSFIFTH